AAFIYAQSAVDPIELHAVVFGLALQRHYPLASQGVCLFLCIAAVYTVAVGLLTCKSQCHSPFIGKDIDMRTRVQRLVQQAEKSGCARTFKRWVHKCEGQSFGLAHRVSPASS